MRAQCNSVIIERVSGCIKIICDKYGDIFAPYQLQISELLIQNLTIPNFEHTFIDTLVFLTYQ